MEKNFIKNFETSKVQNMEVPKKRRPLRNDKFKHAKLINLSERYGDRTPPPLSLEKEEDAELDDDLYEMPIRRSPALKHG